jgi:hypothetical protein
VPGVVDAEQLLRRVEGALRDAGVACERIQLDRRTLPVGKLSPEEGAGVGELRLPGGVRLGPGLHDEADHLEASTVRVEVELTVERGFAHQLAVGSAVTARPE